MNFERLRIAMNTSAPEPLHIRLRNGIQAQIRDETIPPGMKLPSERRLQDELGVSRSTVRQAISALTQAGFLQSHPGSGTFVLDRQAMPTNSPVIGVIVSRPNFHFFYPHLVAAFSDELRQAGYSLILSMHNDRADIFAQLERDLLTQNLGGLAITPPRQGDMAIVDEMIDTLNRRGIPIVMIGRRSTRYGNIDCVSTDNFQIGVEATNYLLSLGHRRIWHIGMLDYSTGQDRYAGYQKVMRAANLEPVMVEMAEFHTQDNPYDFPQSEHLAIPAYQAILDALRTYHEPPTAIFCFNDVVAMGVYKAMREAGLRIPEDISLVSVDNLITVQHFEVPLTTFALPGEGIGRKSANLLLQRMEGKLHPPQQYLLPASFIARASTTPPPNS